MLRRRHYTMANNKQPTPEERHQQQDMEIKEILSHIQHKIVVMSGKGGVGKSSVAAYLALMLADRGFEVGLMDVDLHGPSIPRMLGLKGALQPSAHPNKAIPVRFSSNLHVISIEVLMGEDKDAATIWRGPLKTGVIRQFISDMEWPALDYLIVDSPPGTGDEPLTVAQTIPDAQALIVTTPQEISLADVRKSINFCRKINMKILGIMENMSGMVCPHCGKTVDIFGSNGGETLAQKENLPLLGKLPLDPEIVRRCDSGNLYRMENDRQDYDKAFKEAVDKLIAMTTGASCDNNAVSQQQDNARASDPAGPSNNIIFAVPIANGKLSAHFGHCEQVVLLEAIDGKIKEKKTSTPPPHEPEILPKWLHDLGAQVIIAGGMGSRAKQLFTNNGIKVITGAPMDAPESLVKQYLTGNLLTGDNMCDH